MWVHEAAGDLETWFKAFRGRMQHRLDIAYDDYLYETSWSLQSLTTGALFAARPAFNEVIEFLLFVAVCQLVAGDEQPDL
jgi:hypothetical protein